MTENNEDNKEIEKSKFSKYEINKVVVESYIGTSKINYDEKENKIKNIDNNGPDTNANNDKNNEEVKPKPILSQCPQTNFNLTYHIKTFDLPLLINNSSSLSYLISQPIKKNDEVKENKDSTEVNSFKKGLAISTSSLFISEGQNLKGMRIHLINQTTKNEYDNVVHKEITSLKNSKNKNVENVEINLSDSRTNVLMKSIETIKKRWLQNQKQYKFKLSFINNNETVTINKKKYMSELINKININSTSNSITNNTQEYYLLIKQDRSNKENKYIHEIISPGSKKEFESSINKFILQNSDNKENNDNINIKVLNKNNKRTSQNYIIATGFKKQSKFNNKSSKTNVEENSENPKDTFSPIFILNQSQIKNLFELINKKTNLKKDRKNEQTSSKNVLKNENTKKEKLKNTQKEKIDDLNFNLFPIKVDKFEIIQTGQNEFGGGANMNNNNIDVSNIALNQSDINTMKQIKQGENEDDYSSRKNKETEDFGQNTPISLLHEKYFVYAVSKWAKYSAVIPQFQLYVKYSYKAGRPKFDPINLDTTNFTLWIEKIQTKNKRISTVNTNSSLGNNKMKTKSNSKINAYKSGESIFLNDASNHNDQLKRKKSKSKPKYNK